MAMFAQVLSLRYILYFDIDPLLLLKGEMFLMIFFYVPILYTMLLLFCFVFSRLNKHWLLNKDPIRPPCCHPIN